jgi:hypothetical protein
VRYSALGFLLKSDLYGYVTKELGPKIQKSYVWGLILTFISRDFCVSAVGDNAKKNFFFELGRKKVDLDCFYNHLFTIKRFF